MPMTRSFAPDRNPRGAAEAPPFPMWPYACMAYAQHCSRDYSDYIDRLSKADDAVAVIAAEEALGLNLLSDMNQAFFALVWAPLGAVMGAPGERDLPNR